MSNPTLAQKLQRLKESQQLKNPELRKMDQAPITSIPKPQASTPNLSKNQLSDKPANQGFNQIPSQSPEQPLERKRLESTHNLETSKPIEKSSVNTQENWKNTQAKSSFVKPSTKKPAKFSRNKTKTAKKNSISYTRLVKLLKKRGRGVIRADQLEAVLMNYLISYNLSKEEKA